MSEDWNKQIQDWEDQIRAGHGGLVRLSLLGLKRTEIPREHLCQIVNLSRRTRLERWGMKLLFPYVRGDESKKGASAQEICEYSSALMELGSLDEAKSLLSTVDPKQEPRALLYLAFLCFRNWDGEGARQFLHEYLTHEMGDYARLVGEVNLAAALVQTRGSEEAKRLLAHLEESARSQEKKMLLGNILELRSQIAIQERDWERANKDLEQSALLLQASHHDSLLFTLKWQAVVGLHQGHADAVRRLAEVQQKARRMRLWETVRDCDRHLAVHQVRPDLLNRLYFGSPYKTFRDILLGEYPDSSHLREHYDWIGGKEGKSWKVLVDLGSWEGEGQPHHLRPGHLIHSLVIVLSADLYSPQKMGTLFGALFPGEHFNPHSSPEKVYKVIQRSREWFEGSGLGLSVEQNGGFYRLRVLSGTAVRLRCRLKDSIAKPDKVEHLGEYLLRHFGEGRFSAKQLSENLSVSQRTANRLLKEAQEQGWVEKTGKGPSTRFRVQKKEAS
ncbi:MAG: hypothetical protein H6624_18655 [Bdellovibrionaceae bacterium]|nr:hypothetical protein [Bdellovibrionales bacterium]MCB9086367.1 hypothetical protein [Pseudobdellovibrionaceae bacterium]